ncbi:helix-turn-helix domain-containing protein [Paraburkholderia terrae]
MKPEQMQLVFDAPPEAAKVAKRGKNLFDFSAFTRREPVQALCCIQCGAPAEEMHHVIPRSLGGTATVPLCSACHGKVHGLRGRSEHVALTQSGLARARAAGTKLGRRPALSAARQAEALAKIAAGETIAQVARDFGVTRQIIMRIRDAAAA